MDIEREKKEEPLGIEEARELLAQAWFDFWSGSRTPHDIETRNRGIRGVLERLSPEGRGYFLHEEKDRDSELAKIREGAKLLARTGNRNTPSAGEKRHIRRQKAKRHGTDPRRIR